MTWIDIAYHAVQVVGVATIIKAVLWLNDFRQDVRTIKDNHLMHVEQSQQQLVEQGKEVLTELRELRQDFRSYFGVKNE